MVEFVLLRPAILFQFLLAELGAPVKGAAPRARGACYRNLIHGDLPSLRSPPRQYGVQDDGLPNTIFCDGLEEEHEEQAIASACW